MSNNARKRHQLQSSTVSHDDSTSASYNTVEMSKVTSSSGSLHHDEFQNDNHAPIKNMNRKSRDLYRCKKAVRALAILVTVFVICWLPYYVTSLINAYDIVFVEKWVLQLAVDMLWFNSCINPILYATTNVRYRNGMKNILLYFRRTAKLH